jgi:hypothetical protein
VVGAGDVERHDALETLVLGRGNKCLDPRFLAGDNDLPGRIEIGGFDAEPMMAAMPPVDFSQACCMSRPRSATTFRPVAKLKTPAAVSAVTSPRLRPMANFTSGSFPCSFSAAITANPWTKSAGWQTLVCVSSASGPSKLILLKSQPSTVLASS